MRIIVAMSGGVDSSVAAALLVEQGYEVVGIMLRLWSEADAPSLAAGSDAGREASGPARHNRCCTPEDTSLARSVADQLGIPFYLVNVADTFKRVVVDDFVAEYAAGRTPNPCLNCNRHVRFDMLLNRALGLGAEKLATGHYARLDQPAGRPIRLLRAIDPAKDQSYVLSVLTQEKLGRVMFPLGELTKPQVREIAAQKGLPVATKPESQDLCFLADGDYRGFMARNAPGSVRPGPIRDTSGRVLGEHRGLPYYTIGQRKGIGLSGPEALYVIALDPAENAVVVGPAAELGRRACLALRVNYLGGQAPPAPFAASVKIRYKAREAPAVVTPLPDGSARVEFDAPQRDITPGQGIVFYEGETVVGGGIISISA